MIMISDWSRQMHRGSPLPSSIHSPTIELLFLLMGLIGLGGCVSDRVEDESLVTTYQRQLADAGPQPRLDTRGRRRAPGPADARRDGAERRFPT